MKTRKLGNSDLEVSAIGFGCMGLNFGYANSLSKADGIGLIHTAAERGVTFFATAEEIRRQQREIRGQKSRDTSQKWNQHTLHLF